jgi:MFS family permease
MLRVLRAREFRLLWSAGLLSVVADWMLLTALPFYIYSVTQSALATGFMFISYTISRLAFGMLAGVLVDRWDRRKTMLFSSLVLGCIMPVLVIAQDPGLVWVGYAVSFTQAAVSRFFIPARYACIPQIVKESDLVAANSLDTLSSGITRMVGPLLGGSIVGLLGLPVLVAIVSVLFLSSSFLVSRMQLIGPPQDSEARSSTLARGSLRAFFADFVRGLEEIRQNSVVKVVLLANGLVMVGYGFISVLLVVFAREVHGGDATFYGFLTASQGVGMALGSVIAAFAGWHLSTRTLFSAGLMGTGTFLLLAFHSTAPALSALFLGLSGAAMTAWMVGDRSMLQSAVESSLRGRIFGTYSTVSSTLMLTGTTLSGGLGDHVDIMTLLTCTGLLYLIPGLLSLRLLPRGGNRADQ